MENNQRDSLTDIQIIWFEDEKGVAPIESLVRGLSRWLRGGTLHPHLVPARVTVHPTRYAKEIDLR